MLFDKSLTFEREREEVRLPWREVSLSNLTRPTHGKVIQDSLNFWIPRYGFRIPGNGFWIFVRGTWIQDSIRWWDSGFLELNSRFQEPRFRFPVFRKHKFPIFRGTSKSFPDTGVQMYLVTHVLITFTVLCQFRLKITQVCHLWMLSKWHLLVEQWKEELANLQDIFYRLVSGLGSAGLNASVDRQLRIVPNLNWRPRKKRAFDWSWDLRSI